MAYLLNYTREPEEEAIYSPKLAYSMHLAVSRDGKEYQALNHNSGVLFARATENEDGSLNAKSLKSPWLFRLENGCFGVAAVRVEGDGGDDEESRGCALLFTSRDLLEYQEIGLLRLGTEYIERIACLEDPGDRGLRLVWQDRTGGCYAARLGRPEELGLSSAPETLEAFPEIGATGGQGGSPEIGATREQGGSPESGATGEQGGSPESGATGGQSGSPDSAATSMGFPETGIEGAVPQNIIEIGEETADRLCKKLLTPENTGVDFPERIEIRSREELGQYKATARYSDGTRALMPVDWDLSSVDFQKKGSYEIRGRVHQDHFAFPVAYNRADPCIGRWNGKYYFIATNDADGNHTLFVREADTIPELAEAEERLILDSQTYPGIGGLLWAPEFHEIDGRLYIFHGATPGEFFWEESHVMELREGGNPACKEDWSAPKRVVRKDGSDICQAGKEITLDMTCFCWQGEWYAVWSQRQFLPKDLGAWLYIAKLNPREPWKLLTDPVVLSKPEYGWANNHTFVDEGPFALIQGDTLYLTFSSAAVDTTYVVGLLTIRKGQDLLNASCWRKKNYPLLTSRSVAGEFGTGHNAYVTDENGIIWNTYHARPGVDGVRSSGIRRVHFDIDGEPVLDLTEERDLKEEYRGVQTTLVLS